MGKWRIQVKRGWPFHPRPHRQAGKARRALGAFLAFGPKAPKSLDE